VERCLFAAIKHSSQCVASRRVSLAPRLIIAKQPWNISMASGSPFLVYPIARRASERGALPAASNGRHRRGWAEGAQQRWDISATGRHRPSLKTWPPLKGASIARVVARRLRTSAVSGVSSSPRIGDACRSWAPTARLPTDGDWERASLWWVCWWKNSDYSRAGRAATDFGLTCLALR